MSNFSGSAACRTTLEFLWLCHQPQWPLAVTWLPHFSGCRRMSVQPSIAHYCLGCQCDLPPEFLIFFLFFWFSDCSHFFYKKWFFDKISHSGYFCNFYSYHTKTNTNQTPNKYIPWSNYYYKNSPQRAQPHIIIQQHGKEKITKINSYS